MATSEERVRILNMVQEGKISAEEGAQLLAAIDQPGQPAAPAQPAAVNLSDISGTGRWFHVKITNTQNERTRVNVRLPVSMIKIGMKMGAKFSPEIEKIDMDQLSQFLSSGEIGQLVDVYDDEDGDHIEVFIE